jgi:hypothetical protein
MNFERNPYLKRLDEVEEAKRSWQELDWRLSFLRSISPEPINYPTEQELLQWYTQIKQQLVN